MMVEVEKNMLFVRYPRLGSLIGAVMFGGVTFALIDVLFIHRFVVSSTDWSKGPNFAFGLVFLVLMGFGFAVCFKTVVRPSVLFYADRKGVILGQGVFWNTCVTMDWSEVESIAVGSMRTVGHHKTNDAWHNIATVCLTFTRSSGLRKSRGFRFAHSRNRGKAFVVGENVLGLSAEDAVTLLESLRANATTH